MAKLTDPLIEMIVQEMKNVTDVQAWSLYGNLLITGFDPSGTVKDREEFLERVEDRLENLKSKGSMGKNDLLIEEWLLASIYLENVFLEYKGCDIYTSYWALYHNDLEMEKRSGDFNPLMW